MNYKLLKDIPDVMAGTIFEWNEDQVRYDAQGCSEYGHPKSMVEDNPEWFEPIEEERVKITHSLIGDNGEYTGLEFSTGITDDEQKDIEALLNGETITREKLEHIVREIIPYPAYVELREGLRLKAEGCNEKLIVDEWLSQKQ